MSEHRYNLQPYKGMKSRHKCPECKKSKSFALYVDNETNEPIDDKVGRCNRESECSYHYTPKQFFIDNGLEVKSKKYVPSTPKVKTPIAFFDAQVFAKSLTGYDTNNFVRFLESRLDKTTVIDLINKYKIGSSSAWPGATIFWYVDQYERINYGKIMLYDILTGKRDKVKINQCANVLVKKLTKAGQQLPEWLIKYQANESKINCLFGEHLLPIFPQHPIAIVESEKTAMIASVYLPQFVWLACGSLSTLSVSRCRILRGRPVVLYPDLGSLGKDGDYYLDTDAIQYYFKSNGEWAQSNEPIRASKLISRNGPPKSAFDKWQEKAFFFGFTISNILEKNATAYEKENGLDLADFLLRFKVEDFNNTSKKQTTTQEAPAIPIIDKIPLVAADDQQPETSKINSEVLRLHAQYTAAEASGKLDDHPERSWIGSMWQGVMIYSHKPTELQYYIEQLNLIQL